MTQSLFSPRPGQSRAAHDGSAGPAAPQALRRLFRAVVIDDTPDLRDLLTLVLDRSPDFETVGDAADGRAGIDLVRREHPDVVIIDLAMPVMDGLEALPHIRATVPDAAIVVLSGFGAGAMANRAFSAGADAYVEKGTPAQRIVERIREVIGSEVQGSSGPVEGAPVEAAPSVAAPAEVARAESAKVDAAPAGLVEHEVPEQSPTEENALLRRAIATTAHEIRNPVAVLRGALQALTDDDEGEPLPPAMRDRLVASCARQLRQLETMCTDLLTAAHAGRGRLEIVPESFDVLRLLRELVADRADVTLLHDDVPALPVEADRSRLEQVVTNLLGNATKYGAPPVEVHAWVGVSGRVLVSVMDRGPGVPADFQHRLFNEFARAENSGVAGNGLGLYVVARLMEAHGGSVRYDDRPGGGAVFTVDVPSAE